VTKQSINQRNFSVNSVVKTQLGSRPK